MFHKLKVRLLFIVCIFFAGEGLNAQVEWFLSGHLSSLISETRAGTSGLTIYGDGRAMGLSVETLLGPKQLVPTIGLGLQRFGFSSQREISPEFARVVLPIGVAYRLRPAHTSLNLVASLALQPSIVFGEQGFDPGGGPEEVQWQAKVGAKFTFDPIFFGLSYQPYLGASWAEAVPDLSHWTFSIGIRW